MESRYRFIVRLKSSCPLKIKNSLYSFYKDKNKELAKDTVIPGSLETFVEGDLENSRFKISEGIVAPNTCGTLSQEILVPKSLVDVKDGKVIFSKLSQKRFQI